MDDLAKVIVASGLGITLLGALLFVISRVGGIGRLPQLPGDFVFQSGNMTCFVPLATSLILSVLLTILLNVVLRLLNK